MSDVNVGVPAAKNRNLMAGLDVCPKQVHPSLVDGCGGRAGVDHEHHLGAGLSDQGGTARGAEVVSLTAADASAAVKPICQGVALWCHQALATHHPRHFGYPGPRGEVTATLDIPRGRGTRHCVVTF